MRVWRVEHLGLSGDGPFGMGPWEACGSMGPLVSSVDCGCFGEDACDCLHIDPYGHGNPDPFSDLARFGSVGSRREAIDLLVGRSDWWVACLDTGDLPCWFAEDEVWSLSRAGFVLSEYEVPEDTTLQGVYQVVVFSGERVSVRPVEDILDFVTNW